MYGPLTPRSRKKKNLLPCTKSYHFFTKFTILISFISPCTSPTISLFLFFSIIIFSLLFITIFLWNNIMNNTKFTNWRVINHKKIHSNIYLLHCLSVIHSCHINLWAFYNRIYSRFNFEKFYIHNILTTLSQQILSNRLLLAVIGEQKSNLSGELKFERNNLPLMICCESIEKSYLSLFFPSNPISGPHK